MISLEKIYIPTNAKMGFSNFLCTKIKRAKSITYFDSFATRPFKRLIAI